MINHVQLVIGHRAGCGCPVTQLDSDGYTIVHRRTTCRIRRREAVERVSGFGGQACCSSANPGELALLRLDLPYPHVLQAQAEVAQ